MHKTSFQHANRIFRAITLGALGLILAGCHSVVLTNLTPPTLAQNPSQIYTFSLQLAPESSSFDPAQADVRIVIDGQSYPMHLSRLGANLYEFDYEIPVGRKELKYYYLATYDLESNGRIITREAFTPLQTARIVGRYVLSLEVGRGPVGARVSVLGRGFTPQDTLYFGPNPVRTVFESSNALSFYVPALTPNQSYDVSLNTGANSTPVGNFRIDATSIVVSPMVLNLKSGQAQSLTFTLPLAASAGGMLVDITTNVPDSVIMPEVIIPSGQTSVTVNVKGGAPGVGSLFLTGFGTGEIKIPVTVR